MKLKIGMICVCALVTALFLTSASSAEKETAEKQPNAAIANPFEGKMVTLYFSGQRMETGMVVEEAEIKEVGGRKMLVGIGADTGQKQNWTTGVPVGVAWDSVVMYLAMTKEEFIKKAEEHRK
jgi:hypothetical protein